jgi:hypothetical protein
MTENEVAITQLRMMKNSVGLLGTVTNPTALAMFLEDYIQIQKEYTSMAPNAEQWATQKAWLDCLIGLPQAIRGYEEAYKTKQKEEGNE